MDDPWSNAWSDPADLSASHKSPTTPTWNSKQNIQESEDDEADIAMPSWATGAGINWAEPSQDTHSSLWSQVPPSAGWSPPHSFSDIQLVKAPDLDSTKEPSRPATPEDVQLSSPNPASPISPAETQQERLEVPSEDSPSHSTRSSSPSHSPIPSSSPNPDGFGTFETGATNELDPWPASASPFDAQENGENAWGSAWEDKTKEDPSNAEQESVDEWEAARRMKQEMDRRVPPELLASILKEADEVSSIAWPEPKDLPEELEWQQRWQTGWDSVENLDALRARYLPEMNLPPLPPFTQSFTGKAMINSVKLTRNIALSRSSPMGHFLSGRGSTAWEASIKSRVETVQDEVPAGWRIVEKEQEGKVEEKTKKSGGLLANLWGRRASNIPRQDSKVAQDTSSKSESPVDTARSSMESVKSPSSSTTATTNKVSSPTTLSPSSTSPSTSAPPAPSVESPPVSTYADAGLPSFESISPTSEDKTPEAPQTPSAVTRFFSRFSRRASTPSPHNSMMLSGDDLEFLSDMVPSASDGDLDDEHTDSNDPHLKALENMLASKPIGGKLPAPLPPPPPAPSRVMATLSSNNAGQNSKTNGPASLSFDVLVPTAISRSSSPSSTNPPFSMPPHSSTATPTASSSRPMSPAHQSRSTSSHPRPTHSSRNSRSSLSSVFPSPTADSTSQPVTSLAISQASSQPVPRPMSAASIAASSVAAGKISSPLSSAPHSRSQSPAFFSLPTTSSTEPTAVSPSTSRASHQQMSATAVRNPPSLASQSQSNVPAKAISDDDDDFGDFADFGSSSQSPLAQSSSTFFDDSGFGSPVTTAKPTQTSFTFPPRSAFSSSSHAPKPSTTSIVSSSSSTAWLGRPHAESVTSNGTDVVSHKSLDSFDDEFSSFMGTSARSSSPAHAQRPQAKSPLSTQPMKPMIPLIPLGQPLKRPPSTSRSSSISPSVSAPALSISVSPPLTRNRSLNRPLPSRTSPVDIMNRNAPASSSTSPIDPNESDIIHGNPISASSSYSSHTMSAGRKITRAENHQRTTSLMELAASRPARWPAPISPLPEVLSPPPPSNSGAGLVETDLLGDGDGLGVPNSSVNSVQGSRFAGMQTASSVSQSRSAGLGLLGDEMDDDNWMGAMSNGIGNGTRPSSISPPPAPRPKPPIPTPLSAQTPPFIPAPPLLPPPPRPGSSSSVVGSGGHGGMPVFARGRPAVASNGVGDAASTVGSPRTPTLSPDSTPLAMLVPSGGGGNGGASVGAVSGVNGGGFGSSRSPPPLSPPDNANLLGSGLWGGNGMQSMVATVPTPPPSSLTPVAVVPPVSNGKGAGGLSAQDLSFFEGL